VNYVLPDLADYCRAAEPAPADGDQFIQAGPRAVETFGCMCSSISA